MRYTREDLRVEELIDLGKRLSRREKIVYVGASLGKGVNGVVMVSRDLKGTVKAFDIARALAEKLKGGASGGEEFARFGGRVKEGVEELIIEVISAGVR